MPRACELSGSFSERESLCQRGMLKWKEGAVLGGGCRQDQRGRCASGEGEVWWHGQL